MTDTGVGIPGSMLNRIFEAFTQLVQAASLAAPEKAQAHAAGQPRRFLVVDDNADAAASQAELLRMPGMDGYEVARELRRMPGVKEATLIAQTGWGQEEDRRRTAAAGFDAHLAKPVELGALMETLARAGHH